MYLKLLLIYVCTSFCQSLTLNKCCSKQSSLNLTDEGIICEPADLDQNVPVSDSFQWLFNETLQNKQTLKYDGLDNLIRNYSDLTWFPFERLFNRTSNNTMEPRERMNVLNWFNYGSISTRYGSDNETFHDNVLFQHENSNTSLIGIAHFKIWVLSPNDIEVLINVHDEDNSTHELHARFLVPAENICFDYCPDSEVHLALFPRERIFLQKCCPHGELFDFTNACQSIGTHDVSATDWMPRGVNAEKHPVMIPSFPVCQSVQIHWTPDDHYCRGLITKDEPIYLSDGSVQVNNESFAAHNFCSDVTVHVGGAIIKHNLILCLPEEQPISVSHAVKESYGSLFIIGGFFLLITVAISLYLPQLRQRLHNKIAITHNAALMVAHFAWGPQFFKDDNVHNAGCSIRGLIIQYTFLASLFWLNVFCINMSSSFRTTQTLSSRTAKNENRRYLVYSAYAWGVPAIISLFTIIMEYADEVPDSIIRPGLQCYCQFSLDTFAVFVYFYGPMSVLLTFNLVLYVFTTWKIISVHRQTAPILKRVDSTHTSGQNGDIQKLILYTKLFIIMGITWTMEVASWMFELSNTSFSVLCDLLNILRPIFIFFIFICKRSVFISLRDKLMRATGRHVVRESSEAPTEAMSSSAFGSRKTSHQDDYILARKRSQEGPSVQDILLRPLNASKAQSNTQRNSPP